MSPQPAMHKLAPPARSQPGCPDTPTLRPIVDEMLAVRAEVVAFGSTLLRAWRPHVSRRAFLPGASNLAHYLALRHHDLNRLQNDLAFWGLSSLGRSEGRVLYNLDAVLASLAAIAGESLPAGIRRPTRSAFSRGARNLAKQQTALFGPHPGGPTTRIMATLPTEAAGDVEFCKALIGAGIDCARINCAHDTPEIWGGFVRTFRAAAAAHGRYCPILIDLAGPKLRVDSVFEEGVRLRRGDRFALTLDAPAPPDEPMPSATCSHPSVLGIAKPGAEMWMDDGRLGAIVERIAPWGAVLRVTAVRDKGERLRPDRGLNFPGLDLDLPVLGPKDLADLDFIAAEADLVGFSFVQRSEDIRLLQQELGARRGERPAQPLVLKIETRLAVENLPRLLIASAGRQPTAVMLARGDLAVELGFERLSEIQEEILWLCEAAHIPVIWATQVLEKLIGKGLPSRGETTDAAMAQRAECVMLNKGPHLVEGARFLQGVLRRMDRHQRKKSSRLGPLHSWLGSQELTS